MSIDPASARRPNDFLEEKFVLSFDPPSTGALTNANVTTKLWKVPQAVRIDRVMYNNPTGLAANTTNYAIVELLKGATIVASWSTHDSTVGGTLTADTFVQLINSATDDDLVGVTDDVYSLKLDIHGTQTLPAGRVVIEGTYL